LFGILTYDYCCTEGQRTPTAIEDVIMKEENLEVEGMDDRLTSSGLWQLLM